MFVLAHLSDPHLAPLPAPRASELIGKRVFGYLNWRRKRSAIHRADVLDGIVRDLRAQKFDHLAVTGDLVNIALAAEFRPARVWLEQLGASDTVTAVPGNHDRYVPETAELAQREWGAYMRGDELESFPFVRRRGNVALVGLSSALPTLPLMATGQLGTEQLARLETVLATLSREGLFRVVLIHHPLTSKPSHYFKRLTDSAALGAVLRKHGAELIVHGHNHTHSLHWLEGPNAQIPAVGAPSASASPGGTDEPAGYSLFEIDGAPGAWSCTAIARGFSRGGLITELSREPLYARPQSRAR
jgi:3',5'-cyclic AMP phosphodiesterase CpdA